MNNKHLQDGPPTVRVNRFPFLDNIHTTIFTPSEHQVELLDTARQKNIAVCLASSSGKSFIVVMLVKEFAYQIRGSGQAFKKSFILANNALTIDHYCELVRDHTDLQVAKIIDADLVCQKSTWAEIIESNHVVVTSVDHFVQAFKANFIQPEEINFLLVDECHLALRQHPCRELMSIIPHSNGINGPRLVGLSTSVLERNCDPAILERRLIRLEKATRCVTETSSSLVLLSRYSNRPEELVIECDGRLEGAADQEIRNVIYGSHSFLKAHSYCLEDIYGMLDDDMRAIPDPTVVPLAFLSDLLDILETLGPWCADRAAWFFMKELKKHKDKTPYERHYLLLSLVFSVMEQVRAICDYHFRSCADEKERMLTFATPKVLRLLEVLKFYKPAVDPRQEQRKAIGDITSHASSAAANSRADIKSCENCDDSKRSTTDANTSSSSSSSLSCSCDCTSSAHQKSCAADNLSLPESFCCSFPSTSLAGCDQNSLPDSTPQENLEASSEIKFCDQINGESGVSNSCAIAAAIDKCHDSAQEHDQTCAISCENILMPNHLSKDISLSQVDKASVNSVPDSTTKKPVGSWNAESRPLRTGRWSTPNGPGRSAFINDDPNSLWGIVFVERRYSACILNMYLKELSKQHEEFRFVSPNFIMGQRQFSLCMDGTIDPKETQMEHRKQEEVLRRFRMHESNVLVATSIVEDGVDLPKCNLVVRFDPPRDYKSYTQSKGRAKAIPSRYLLLVDVKQTKPFLHELCKFRALEEILLSRCHSREIPVDEEIDLKEADKELAPYFPNLANKSVKVTMSSAISVVNRYCARLPSDTFTRLVPHCTLTKLSGDPSLYQARLYLPINSPIKIPIEGPAMPNAALAKLATAMETCKILHQSGELDDNLMLVGKISTPLDVEAANFVEDDEEIIAEGAPRPGTTKRRQYYNKQTAQAFQHCLPLPNQPCHFYRIHMKLTCPIPDEQNIRGRQIYEPASTSQGFGVLTSQEVPEICGFPVFTRSGEVAVKLVHVSSHLLLTQPQLEKLSIFHRYTFTNVLRLEKYPMCYDMKEAENSLLIIPINKGGEGYVIDWPFVDAIINRKNAKPTAVPESERQHFGFEAGLYQDAVVMPWYRNLDQPQYFYVAEVCYHLTPHSDFPDDDFETFDKYYLKKYGIQIQNRNQPLLDVDHTSARLNLLTPRYVNRKGVALPTSSEETKRAKRENLQQKQILVPELCTIHPFSASLWRKAVCLPCILYRLNCLLLAEELRVRVVQETGFGQLVLRQGKHWPPLDFGWSLADVVKARRQAAEGQKSKDSGAANGELSSAKKGAGNAESTVGKKDGSSVTNGAIPAKGRSERPKNLANHDNFSIGTWSNDMVSYDDDDNQDGDLSGDDDLLPEDLMILNSCSSLFDGINNPNSESDRSDSKFGSENGFDGAPRGSDEDGEHCSEQNVRYGSPSNFELNGWDCDNDLEFDVMDIPGLGFLSAPGGRFNMEDLSRDLKFIEAKVLSPNAGNEDTKKQRTSQDEDEDEYDEGDHDDDLFWPVASVGPAARSEGEGGEREWSVSFDWDAVDHDTESEAENEACLQDCRMRVELMEKKIKFISASEELQLEKLESVQDRAGGNPSFNKPSLSVAARRDPVSSHLQSITCDNALCTTTTNTSSISTLAVIYENGNKEVGSGHTNGWPSESDAEMNSHNLTMAPVNDFSFDFQPDLSTHPGPSPSILLQALTMSNANDGINLERLETIGDSFLKHAITTYLFCMYPNIHEGKLSHLRSKQVSNLKLYRLGRKKGFANFMVATKFEPNDNWLPPGYLVPKELEQALIDSGIPAGYWNIARLPDLAEWRGLDTQQIRAVLAKHGEELRQAICESTLGNESRVMLGRPISGAPVPKTNSNSTEMTCFIPYNLMTQHSIPDKSIADCVEAQIGAYLTSCGPRGALLFMSWLGIDVLPKTIDAERRVNYGFLGSPPSPMQCHLPDADYQLRKLLHGYDKFQALIGYQFRDLSYLLQAFTHASYHYNRLTDCYQRLEFLGDAVLDYLITRHLYEDARQHSPGTLTDLRSALVNNTIFATLAVRYDFHKYFKALCPTLFVVIDRFIRMQKENDHRVNEELYFMEEEECEEVEDIEVPKALGDVFESVAGAIYLDSGMNLDSVWKVYYSMMKSEIELFSTCVPKSPIRELLEKEPETAKFGKPERTLDGKVRVTVEVFGKGRFTALGRNYRIAKCTAAKHALKALRKLQKGVSDDSTS